MSNWQTIEKKPQQLGIYPEYRANNETYHTVFKMDKQAGNGNGVLSYEEAIKYHADKAAELVTAHAMLQISPENEKAQQTHSTLVEQLEVSANIVTRFQQQSNTSSTFMSARTFFMENIVFPILGVVTPDKVY